MYVLSSWEYCWFMLASPSHAQRRKNGAPRALNPSAILPSSASILPSATFALSHTRPHETSGMRPWEMSHDSRNVGTGTRQP